MRSTFRILFYINRNKTKKNGKAAVLCRITVDGRSAVIATGEECAPEAWQTKSGETGDRKINLRLQALRERIEASYTTLLRRECRDRNIHLSPASDKVSQPTVRTAVFFIGAGAP